MRPNAMKQRLEAGQPAFGVSIMIPSPQLVEIVGRLGFHWVLIDCEHGTINPETVETLALAAEASGLTPIARPRTKDPADIQQVMDRGVAGVQVPHVNTADDARRAVGAVKFHPLGRRGLAAGTRPADYGIGLSPTEYVEQANRETLVCVQLEEEEAVGNVDAILQVEGVDVFFIGPADLSQSMGFPGNPKAPPVAQAIAATFDAIHAAGKVSGTPAHADAVRGVLDRGVRYTYTHVTKLLAAAAKDFLAVAGATD